MHGAHTPNPQRGIINNHTTANPPPLNVSSGVRNMQVQKKIHAPEMLETKIKSQKSPSGELFGQKPLQSTQLR